MQILVFDTETSGLPPKANISILQTNKWPYILQLAWILYDTEKRLIVDKLDTLIKIDPNIILDPSSIAIHKITQEKLQNEGKPIHKVLEKFNIMLNWADMIVGHNIIFDKNMLLIEGQRNNISINLIRYGVKIPQYCTMFNSIHICKLPFINSRNSDDKYKNTYKYPKLSELIYCLFNEENINFHNAFIDVIYTLRGYYKLEKDIDLFNVDLSLKKLL